MRKKWIWVLAASMVMSTCILGGCSGKKAVTAESIMQEVSAKTEKAKSFAADMDIDMSMNISAEGVGMDMDIGMTGTIESTMEPEVAHIDMTMNMSLLNMSMDMDVYTQIADGKMITYTGMAGQWTKVEEDYEEGDTQALQVMFADLGNMTLSEETEEIDGKEVYVLTSIVTGDQLQEIMSQMGTMASDMSGMDFSTLQADVVLKVYKDTFLPAVASMSMADGGEGVEVDGVITKINSISVTMNYTGFDTVEAIEIPEEALNAESADTEALLQ